MYALIALGNPGNQYAKTRHNVGWIVVDNAFSDIDFRENKYAFAEVGTAELEAIHSKLQNRQHS